MGFCLGYFGGVGRFRIVIDVFVGGFEVCCVSFGMRGRKLGSEIGYLYDVFWVEELWVIV